MSGRWFRPNFHVESFLRSIIQESHIFTEVSYLETIFMSGPLSCREFLEIYNTREPHHFMSRDHHELALISSKFSCREFLEIYYKRATSFTEVSYLETIFMSGRWFRPKFHVESFLRSIIQESHIIHRSELSGDHFHEWAMISSKFSCREFLEIYNTREPQHSQKWAIWRPFSWVGDDFVQIFMSRVSWDLLDHFQESHINHRSDLSGDHFLMSGRWFCPNFHVESFLRSIIQESHIIHRSELSGDHFHEWAMVSSKISCREFLEIYNTREPQHSQKWAIWRPFSWVGDDFVQIFMSRVSWDL